MLAAVNRSSPQHGDARPWLERALGGGAPVGFAWLALVGFVRISTRPDILNPPLTVDQATGILDEWLAKRSARILQPGERHAALFSQLLAQAGTAGNLTNDAHLAALAIEHRATVVTFDTDFDRFPGVRTERPA
ncbi:MAG: PIN domain-containing protein [Nocardioidaceae bacterium]|nr:PIN domain-containing protein [Nocardioidaceae bacterium]MCL2612544.1 PIN domain-containing protein [Nocardioidaceae bacterium]